MKDLNHYTHKDVERFLNKVDIKTPDECWLWTGARDGGNYGRFLLNHTRVRAHRFSYRVYHGPFDGSLCVCHSCDNPSCVNPFHLFSGTHKDNTQDMFSKGRQAIYQGIQQRNNTTGYVGVSFHKNINRFIARIHSDNAARYIGCFLSAVDAAKAYDDKAIELFGSQARLNFPTQQSRISSENL